MTARVSKSRFLSGWQCSLKLWNDVYRPDLAAEPSESQEALFATGHEVGAWARARWPDGVLVDLERHRIDEAAARTRELMEEPSVTAIFEGVVTTGEHLTRADVLVRAGPACWDLVEVKSSTKPKEVFQVDVAFQYWVLRQAGVPVNSAGLLLLDRDYVYPDGPIDPNALFKFVDCTEVCRARWDEIEAHVQHLRSTLRASQPPSVDIGPHCSTPYDCPYWSHCAAGIQFPEHPIDILPRLKGARRQGLLERGIETVDAIPSDYALTAQQERVKQCIQTGEPWVSPGLRAALDNVDWPLYYLDFEAVLLAIPQHAGMRPYDALPFQFSCHIESQSGTELGHREFLAPDASDPRRALALELLDAVSTHGSIIAYTSYEANTIERLAQWLPDLADALRSLKQRIVDLEAIVRNHYCHPAFKGSTSIKSVLPALAPDLSYGDLEVADGMAAGRAWLQMIQAESRPEQQHLDSQLRAYCQLDSYAMYRLRQALKSIANSP